MEPRISFPGGKSEEALEVQAFIERLTAPYDSAEPGVFESKQKLFMFAAALGASREKRTQLEQRDSGAAMRIEIFQNHSDDAFISAVAVADRGELGILRPEEEEESTLCRIAEEYAYTGLLELMRKTKGRNALEVLVDIVGNAEVDSPSPEMAGMPNDVLSGLMDW